MDMEVDNYHCGNCKFFRVDADRNESLCKRIDHKTVKFYHPWFKSYDCNQHSGVVCSDFIPASWCVHAAKVWEGFDIYWENYVKQWLNCKTISFFINGDTSVSYQVPVMDFVYNTMFDNDGNLKAISKQYYKRSKESPIGYKLITEKIDDPVCIRLLKQENDKVDTTTMKFYEDAKWSDYKNMSTNIKGYENISYEEKRCNALSEVKQYISDCKTIQDVRRKIDSDPNVQESGRLYLEWAVINTCGNKVWWATRED